MPRILTCSAIPSVSVDQVPVDDDYGNLWIFNAQRHPVPLVLRGWGFLDGDIVRVLRIPRVGGFVPAVPRARRFDDAVGVRWIGRVQNNALVRQTTR